MKRILLVLILFGLAAYAQPTIGPATFAGTGLNDAISGGRATVSENVSLVVTVSCVAGGSGCDATHDSISAAVTDHTGTASVFTGHLIVAGTCQAIYGGVCLTFGAASGHHAADSWSITVRAHGTSATETVRGPGVGAIVRSVEDRLADAATVKDFAAVRGDGDATTDDAPALNAALRNGAGKTLSLPEGVYYLRSTVTIPAGTHLIGAGTNRTKLWTDQAIDMVMVDAGENTWVEGFAIQGTSGVTLSGITWGSAGVWSIACNLHHVRFDNFTDHALTLIDWVFGAVDDLNVDAYGAAYGMTVLGTFNAAGNNRISHLFLHDAGETLRVEGPGGGNEFDYVYCYANVDSGSNPNNNRMLTHVLNSPGNAFRYSMWETLNNDAPVEVLLESDSTAIVLDDTVISHSRFASYLKHGDHVQIGTHDRTVGGATVYGYPVERVRIDHSTFLSPVAVQAIGPSTAARWLDGTCLNRETNTMYYAVRNDSADGSVDWSIYGSNTAVNPGSGYLALDISDPGTVLVQGGTLAAGASDVWNPSGSLTYKYYMIWLGVSTASAPGKFIGTWHSFDINTVQATDPPELSNNTFKTLYDTRDQRAPSLGGGATHSQSGTNEFSDLASRGGLALKSAYAAVTVGNGTNTDTTLDITLAGPVTRSSEIRFGTGTETSGLVRYEFYGYDGTVKHRFAGSDPVNGDYNFISGLTKFGANTEPMAPVDSETDLAGGSIGHAGSLRLRRADDGVESVTLTAGALGVARLHAQGGNAKFIVDTNATPGALEVADNGDTTVHGTLSAIGGFNLPAVGTPGTYTRVTTDTAGRVSAGSALSAGDIPASLSSTTSVNGTNIPASSTLVVSVDGASGAVTTWVVAPATAVDVCTAGQRAYDTGYLYVCVATNTWRRTALTPW